MVMSTHHDGIVVSNYRFKPGDDVDIDIDLDLDVEMRSNTDVDETESSATKSAFEQTNESLLRLQAILLDRFRVKDGDDDNYGEDNFDDIDVPFNHTLAHVTAGGAGGGGNTNGNNNQPDVNIDIASVSPNDAPKVLRDVVRKLFGGSRSTAHAEPLKYEVLEERVSDDGKAPRYSCILTLFRPTGSSRSYRTKSEYSKSSEAKAAAAYLALRLGAVEFIKNGDKSRDRIQLVPLGRLGTGAVEEQPAEERDTSGDLAILDIENCCTEWRSGTVHPQWIYLTDNRFYGSYGCALKISLSSHVQRAYSVVPGGIISSSTIISYPSKSHAKSACAKLAIAEGVLDFIKHGDGLEQPVRSFDHPGASGAHFGTPAATVLTLQAFYDSLPKPMPDSIGTKMNGDFNAIPWLNSMIQMTKGSRMTSSFHWYTDPKVGLHGCLLRLTRPDGPSKTYMIDACFSKRSDAKVAVCLWACSQGLGTYVQEVATEIDSYLTPEMRRRCEKELLPGLGGALRKIRPGLRVDFSYVCDLASFCCTLTIDLSMIVDTETASAPKPNALSPKDEPEYDTADKKSKARETTPSESGNGRDPTTPEHADTENSPPPPPSVTAITIPPRAGESGTGSGTENETKPSKIDNIKKIWVTRTKSQYKSKQDARVAAICLAVEEGVMQWVELFEGLGNMNGSREFKFGKGISGVGFAGKGMGYRGRKRGFGIGLGSERGVRRPQAFGRGFGRGRGGGYSGYGFKYGNAAASGGRAPVTSNNFTAIAAGSSRSDASHHSYTNANMDLEEGEMLDGNDSLISFNCGKNLGKSENDLLGVKAGSSLGRTELSLLNGRPSRGRGVGFGRGRGRGLSTMFPAQQSQKVQAVMPHINPRFFPHLNVIPPQYPPHYQPPPPAPTVGYSYATYYNPAGAPGYEQEWYEEDEKEEELVSENAIVESSSLLQARQRVKLKHANSRRTLAARASQSSQVLRQQQKQQEGSATQQSAHHGSQLDTADTASEAGIGPQLLPSSVDADKSEVELGNREAVKTEGDGVKEMEIDNDEEVKDKGKDPEEMSVPDRGDNDISQKMEDDNAKDERELAASTSSYRASVSETLPSSPRAMRSHRDSRYSNSNHAPFQRRRYPSEYSHYGQSAIVPPPPPPPQLEYTIAPYPYPYPYQQQPHIVNYQPHDHYDYYYRQEPQVQVYTVPVPTPFSGHYVSHRQAHPQYAYPTGYGPVSPAGPGGHLPPSGPRAMVPRSGSMSSNIQSEAGTKQPPSAPKAMIQKLKGRDTSVHEAHSSSFGKRPARRMEDDAQTSGTAGFVRKRMKVS